MEDSVNGGLKLTIVNGATWIDFNNIRSFGSDSLNGICVMKLETTANAKMMFLFAGNVQAEVTSKISWSAMAYSNDILFKVDAHANIDSGLGAGEENNWHCYKIQTDVAQSRGTIDGVLCASTSDIPDAVESKLNPRIYVAKDEAVATPVGYVRYCEAWNS